MRIELDQKVIFDPSNMYPAAQASDYRGDVIGTVIFVHPSHRYFTVRYDIYGNNFLTSFNFNDIFGRKRTVRLIKETA